MNRKKNDHHMHVWVYTKVCFIKTIRMCYKNIGKPYQICYYPLTFSRSDLFPKKIVKSVQKSTNQHWTSINTYKKIIFENKHWIEQAWKINWNKKNFVIIRNNPKKKDMLNVTDA